MKTKYKIHKFQLFILLIITCITVNSCGSKKKLVYFQDSVNGSSQAIAVQFVPKIEVGDVLSIEVTGTDPDVASPYNQAELVRQGNQIGSYDNGVPATHGYLVSSDSTVSMPIIGDIKVAGLTRKSAIELVESILAQYLEKPNVSMRILNFKITVLGEVETPGTFSIPNERVTILEAIGIANDLKITGERKNVLVIRHIDGEKKEYIIDLTSNELFSSPAYYLKQNDVVYVSPNRKSRYDSSLLRSAGGVIISATSLIISTLILIFR
ncbi:MAG: polysaccharide biosynthesis/export family protein [Crocinitomicaceae bacterium]|nr:polysaccharide biosynthesis/export family protein [Crocinitomicaceae bacterium]